MLGHRGCRLGITTPDIYRMQVRAIVEAVLDCREAGIDARPEIMIPLVGTAQELDVLAQHARAVIEDVCAKRLASGDVLHIPVGTMIEIPRACVTAGQIAPVAEFFSFGTNDLTYGFSRDDAGAFLPAYVAQEILPTDPFQSIDVDGVGSLMRVAVEQGRHARQSLKVGVCGEHGGDPASIQFCHELGLDYVSCSPYRVPIARLAAAQAALRDPAVHDRAGRFVRSSATELAPT